MGNSLDSKISGNKALTLNPNPTIPIAPTKQETQPVSNLQPPPLDSKLHQREHDGKLTEALILEQTSKPPTSKEQTRKPQTGQSQATEPQRMDTKEPSPTIRSNTSPQNTAKGFPDQLRSIQRTIEGWLGRIELSDQEFANCEVKVDDPAIALLCKGRLNQKSTNRLMDRIRDQALHGPGEKAIEDAFRVLARLGEEYTYSNGFLFFDRNSRMCGKLQNYYRSLASLLDTQLKADEGARARIESQLTTLDRLVVLEAHRIGAQEVPDRTRQPCVSLCCGNDVPEELYRMVGRFSGDESVFAERLSKDRESALARHKDDVARQRGDDARVTIDKLLAPPGQRGEPVPLTDEGVAGLLQNYDETRDAPRLVDLLNRLNEKMCLDTDESARALFRKIYDSSNVREAVQKYSWNRLEQGSELAKTMPDYRWNMENILLERFLSPPLLVAARDGEISGSNNPEGVVSRYVKKYFGPKSGSYAKNVFAQLKLNG